MEHAPIRAVDGGVEVDLLIVPNARRPGVVGVHGNRVKIRVASPPEKNKANAAVIEEIRRVTRTRHVEITRGRTGRHKTVFLKGMTVESVRGSLNRDV